MTEYTGAMIALAPTDGHANAFAVSGGLPPEDLHITLVFLGGITELGEDSLDYCRGICEQLSVLYEPVELVPFASASFNPNSEQAAVYLIGDSEQIAEIAELSQELCVEFIDDLASQHSPWIPHMTIGYGMGTDKLTRCESPILFDKLRLAIGDEVINYPLGIPNDDFENPLLSAAKSELDGLLNNIEQELVSAGYDRHNVSYERDPKGEFDTPPSGHYTSGSTKADSKGGSKNSKIKLYIETKSQKADRARKSRDKHQGKSINRTGNVV